MRGFKAAIAFTGGAVIGGLATYTYLNHKQRDELCSAREELRAYYSDKTAKETEIATAEAYEELDRVKTELTNLQQKVEDNNKQKNSEQTKVQEMKAYIIKPDEFGTIPDYDRFYYTYCVDDGRFYIDAGMDVPAEAVEINDMFQSIHPEEYFGVYEDDTVYVRNDELHTDIAVYLADNTPEETEE